MQAHSPKSAYSYTVTVLKVMKVLILHQNAKLTDTHAILMTCITHAYMQYGDHYVNVTEIAN